MVSKITQSIEFLKKEIERGDKRDTKKKTRIR